ncbi:hypothetical protein WMY93_007717 [Mugilogobius chulae]|uniref:THAP-type domain-containing protein n=1 Tax=Mugilogobius chulae TaxID=88201 RepID=A0AAW0PIX0_9GOBI
MTDCCAAANCASRRGEGEDTPLFSFPLDAERCKLWLMKCHRQDLASETPDHLHKTYKLCAKHFEPDMISQQDDSNTALKEDAVPTIFDLTVSVNNQSVNRKRAGDQSEEDHTSIKKTKEDTTDACDKNSSALDLQVETQTQEDVAICKAKDTLRAYFKEILALTGFSINGTNTTDDPIGGARGQQSFNRICVEKIDKKEILQLSEDLMREEIQNSLRLARFFSILIQEVTIIEGKEQIPVYIRSVTVAGLPQKHLIGFFPCDVDVENLFYLLISELRNKWGLRMEHCRGISYLVKGKMCQKIRDLTCKILQEFPQVALSPSEPYAFNIWIMRCMPVASIQNVADTVEEVASLLRKTPELFRRLEGKIQMTYGHIKGEVDRIKTSLNSNWEYGTDAFLTMLDILEPFLNCINEIISKVDEDTAEQMARLKPILKNFNFIITLVVLKNTLCCVSILNSSLRGIISVSSTLQYSISNALKLLSKYQQELAILHRKWFADAVGRAKKLGVEVTKPEIDQGNAAETPLEDLYRETLSRPILQYLVLEVNRVLGIEMVRILRWLSLVPSYMADHNFSIRRDKVADANLNNLARPDTFYEELGCWEVKWRHASKRRILPTTVFATLKIPDIGFYPNVQNLLRVLGTVPCVNAEADVYGQYHMVQERCQVYLNTTAEDQRQCSKAFIYVNQDVHFNTEKMVDSYVQKHPDILQLLQTNDNTKEKPAPIENQGNHAEKDTEEELQLINLEMDADRLVEMKCAETDREALKSALQSAVVAAYSSQNRDHTDAPPALEGETEYVTKSEMQEVLVVCENAVREGILMEVGGSFFSLFIDRVVKMGENNYLPLFLKFVDSFDVMRLELLGFLEANLSCEAMVKHLFEIVTVRWNLDLKNCRGQAYLGSGDVSYKLKAFACKIQEKFPLAISTHCSSYSLNMWWSKSIPVPAITRALETFEEVMMFYGSNEALEKQLDHVIAKGLKETFEKVQELQGKFSSVWQEKHDSYEVFVQMLEPLFESLGKIKNNPQRWKALSERALALLQKMMDFDFIMAMVVLKNTSSFTKDLSAGLQKDHFSAASQLCHIGGIVATLNRVKTNIKVFHQNWFDEACAIAQNLRVQVEVPESSLQRDGMMKPVGFYKDSLNDHKEALNFLSLVPSSVTKSYMFESLKSKLPLYSYDLPDADNFFTELCCWRVTWKTKASVTTPSSLFQTLRLPLMQYFGNINVLLKIMSVLPSTALEDCGVVMRHKRFLEYLRNTDPQDRSPCLALLQVSSDFSRDLDRMVTQCLKATPQALEGICLERESKFFNKNTEIKTEVETVKVEHEEPPSDQLAHMIEDQEMKAADENGHSGDNCHSLTIVFKLAAELGKKDLMFQELSMCHWFESEDKCNIGEAQMNTLVIKDSPFFSLIIDKPVYVNDQPYLPVFVRYVGESVPKVELVGFLPLNENGSVEAQAHNLAKVLSEDWGLDMAQCRGQAFMNRGAGFQSLKKMSLDFLQNYPLAVVTPSESCGLSHWLVQSVPCPSVVKTLNVAEDLLLFFDAYPGLEKQLAQAVDGLLNVPREAIKESPETCYSRWRKREDFFDELAETLDGVLSCLDAVGSSVTGVKAMNAQVLSTALRNVDFIISLLIIKMPVLLLATAAQFSGVEKIPSIIETLSKTLANIIAVHHTWFEQAFQLASKIAPEQLCFSEEVNGYESPEVYYRENLSIPLLTNLIDAMKYNFSDGHLKALSVLSLLPSCNPQPIQAESTSQPFSLGEQEINAWSAVWREKFQDIAPPTSIAETLAHVESKSYPTVALLLRQVAVLPSVSMEFDLMKTTLNSIRDVFKNTVCKGSKLDHMMLLSHALMLQRLPEVIETCMELNPESKPCLSKVMTTLEKIQLESEVAEVDIVMEESTMAPIQQLPETSEITDELRKTVSFYDPQQREQILKEFGDFAFFTIITEQAVGIEGHLYIPLCIRYLNKDDIQCEETLAFIPFTEDVHCLAEAVERVLSEKWGLKMEYCRGQAMLCVGEVGGQMSAVCSALAAKYPKAVKTICSAQSLNVWLAKTSPVMEIANSAVLIQRILHWFTEDVERQNRLEDMILHVFSHDEGKSNELRDKLTKNWNRSHDMHQVMVEVLEAVVLCLNELKGQQSTPDEQQATEFFNAIRNFEFILGTVVQKNVLKVTYQLSEGLLGKPLDMLLAVKSLPDLKAQLGQLLAEVDCHHKNWFEEAVALASKLNVTLLHSALLEQLSEFYKESVSTKVIEHSRTEIESIFTQKVTDTLRCLEIVPYAMSKVETSILSDLVGKLYKEDLPDEASLQSEMQMWKDKWLDPLAGYLPTTVLDALQTSQIRGFVNIETLLRLQVILPFSRRESNFRQGKRSLQEFLQQDKRSLGELHPLE